MYCLTGGNMAKPKPKPGSITFYNMRFPTDLKAKVEAIAKWNGRSLNAEIVMTLRDKYGKLDQNGRYQKGMSSFSVDAVAGAPGGDAGTEEGS